ncbi:helix-turn-helix domain-containing protein [Roseibium sp. M-1]
MELRTVFARNLRYYRKKKGLSQETLAHEADIDRTYVSALERGNYAASIDMIEKLASVLEIDPSTLLCREQN